VPNIALLGSLPFPNVGFGHKKMRIYYD